MAATAPAKPFEVGQTVLVVMLAKEPFFAKLRENGTSLSGDFGDVLFSVQKNGRTNGGAMSRIAFTVEEAIEMGYVAPTTDKADVIAWNVDADGICGFMKHAGFYDAKNKCLYQLNGHRNGAVFSYYRELTQPEARAIWGTSYDSIKSKLED